MGRQGGRFTKGSLLYPAALLSMLLAITSCSGSGAGSPAGGTQKIILKLMYLWPDGNNSAQNRMVKEIIGEFETAHPNITIDTEALENEQYKSKMKVLAASNDLPDIGFTWAAGFMDPYVKGNKFAPLDDLLNNEFNGKFVAGTTEAYSFGGRTYALPVELNIVPVYYNKEIFAKYNLLPPKSLYELKAIIRTLNNHGVTPIALGSKDGWPASFWYMYLAERYGGPNLLDKAVAGQDFTNPSLLRAAMQVQELVKLDAFTRGYNGLSNDEAKAQFMGGKAAMYAMGTWEVPNYTTAEDVTEEFKAKIGYFKFPKVEGGMGSEDDWVGGPGTGLFVSENSEHVREAKQFVSFFVQKWGEHSVVDAGVIPATKVDTAAIKLPPMFVDLLDELNRAHKVTLYLDTQMKPWASSVHINQVQALFARAITPEEFIAKQDEALKTGK
ncbi:extracellular solute-binding protein [Paenibacillus sp. NFR01]|uniref:extracellular solute-binding protein n=1 Tax=Paenibacillus sp. NFR01 TaxID=1566279 RepID=UPI0008ABD408|nr:extracellular solute-binding protein [Paenibacillus sp. NFR01]SET55949.1 raffinose/stachyose/melibiose transport system substrate-binding protein [Paenibacillus sp. NFR01]